MVFLAVILVLFASLTVEIDADHLRIRFGIGLIRKRFPLDQIDTCRPVKQPLDLWLGHPPDTPRLALQCFGTGSGGTEDEERQNLSHWHGRARGPDRRSPRGTGQLEASAEVIRPVGRRRTRAEGPGGQD